MSLFEHALLADENIHPEVVRSLVTREVDVVSAVEAGLAGAGDASILKRANAEKRVPPFLVVAHRRKNTIRIRMRRRPT